MNLFLRALMSKFQPQMGQGPNPPSQNQSLPPGVGQGINPPMPPPGGYTFANRNYMLQPGTPNPFPQQPPAQPQGLPGTTPMNAILRGYFGG